MAADNDLLIIVQVDGKPALAALSQVEGAAGRVTAEVSRLDAGFTQLAGGLVVPKSTADELNRIAAAARNVPRSVGPIVAPGAVDPGAAVALRGVKDGSAAAQQAVFGFAATLDDAQQFQYGFTQGMRAIGNNFQPLIQGFASMQAQASASGVGLASTLGAALTGPAGILVGLTVVAAAAPLLADAFDDAFTSIPEMVEEAADKVKALNDAVLDFEGSDFGSGAVIESVEQANAILGNMSVRAAGEYEKLRDLEAALAAETTSFYDSETRRTTELVSARGQVIRNEIALLESQIAGMEANFVDVRTRIDGFNTRRTQAGLLVGLGASDREALDARRDAERDAEREAERERKKVIRDAATAQRRADREAVAAQRKANNEARQVAEAQARLTLQLRLEVAREGSDRALEQTRQEYAERARIASDGTARITDLELQVQLAYARQVRQIEDADLRQREDRLLANIDRIRQARDRADLANGQTSEEVAARRVQQIRDEADLTAEFFAARALEENNAVIAAADLAAVIRDGTDEQVDRLAVLAAEYPVLQGVLDLVLARKDGENDIVAAVRSRRIETEAERRANAISDGDLDARRRRAAARIANPGRAADPTADARASVVRLQAALAALDSDIADATGTRVEAAAQVADAVLAAESSTTSVVVEGQRIIGGEVRALAAERKQLARNLANAEADADDAKADKVVQNYDRQAEAAREFARNALDAIEEAFTRQRRFSDLDIEVAQDRYEQEERDLRESLRNREITQRDFTLSMRQLAQERGQFEAEVARDTASTLSVIAVGLAATLRDAALSGLKAVLVEAAAKQAAKVLAKVPFPLNLVAAGGAALAVLGIEQIIRSAAGFATGGPVYGPGTGTSDDVPAWLSHGEHVITSRAAQGQHGALSMLNRQMEAGLNLEELLAMMANARRFSSGGAAFLTPRPMPARLVLPLASGTSGTSPGGVTQARFEALIQSAERAALAAETASRAAFDAKRTLVTDADALRITRRASRQSKLRGAR